MLVKLLNMSFVLLFFLLHLAAASRVQMPGGIFSNSLNNFNDKERDNFFFLLQKASDMFNRECNSLYRYRVDKEKIENIRTQVVSGIKYIVDVQMVPTTCQKNHEVNMKYL